MAKYDPLKLHLSQLAEFEWTAGFDEIERILGCPLPPSASSHRTWWANSGGMLVHQESWLSAGWRVRHIDIARRHVTFHRARVGAVLARVEPPAPKPEPTIVRNGANGALPAPVRKAIDASRKPLNLSARIDWSEIGCGETCDDRWRLPAAGMMPALCRFHIFRGDDHRILVVITRNLDRFLRAVESGEANGCNAARAREVAAALAGAEHVVVDAATPGQAWILVDGRGHKADLIDDGERWLVAWAAAVGNRQAGVDSMLLAN